MFCETTFPFSQKTPETPLIQAADPPVLATAEDNLLDSNDTDEDPTDQSVESEPAVSVDLVTSSDNAPVQSEMSNDTSLGRGHRTKITSSRLCDYFVGTVSLAPPSDSSTPQPSSGTRYPLLHYISEECFSENYKCYLAKLTNSVEPKSFKEAMQYDEWKQDMRAEIDSLEDNHTWYLVDLPPNKRLIGCYGCFV